MNFACLQISYNDLAYLCAEVAGIDKSQVKLEHYNSGEYFERRACWHRKKTGLLTLDATQICWERVRFPSARQTFMLRQRKRRSCFSGKVRDIVYAMTC
jgi:hypothetical protein